MISQICLLSLSKEGVISIFSFKAAAVAGSLF
ncbi:hypothetical protein V6Z11_D07G031700 [Gossypium hirsutum]|uniref:Uncharacterized protein n=1 Tax=Gossypium tomentosum TaxID=34277 RepID=A0A5D2K211_GOSTO|nr:hypothetical protein ES332_D07G033400v1 [Gossypium tomentosum]